MTNPFRKKNKSSDPHFDLRQADSDHDGLSDYDEINVYGTDPNNPDTDNDGMNDYDEIKAGRNPLGPGFLKDLFIPYAGNDYQPKILHPYRLLFYSVSVIFVQFLVIGFVLLFPISAWLTPDILSQESKKVIALTNTLRSEMGVGIVKENQLLDQAAYNKAEDMLVRQYFAHVGPDQKNLASWIGGTGYKYDMAGENLALGFTNATDVVAAWKKSPTHYANLVDSDFADIGVSMVSGPFNGRETTLVAQYFAYSSQVNAATAGPVQTQVAEPVVAPKPSPSQPQPAAKPATNVNANTVKPITPAPVKTTQSSKVVAVKKPPASPLPAKPVMATPVVKKTAENINQAPVSQLAVPILVFPQDNYLSRQANLTIIIYAPGAQQVSVLSSGEIIAEKTSLRSDFFDFVLNLKTGNNQLTFEAMAGTEKKSSSSYNILIDTHGPTIDAAQSKVAIVQPDGQKEKILSAVAYLDGRATKAEVSFGDYKINLEKTDESSADLDKWSGELIIFNDDEKKIFNTVVLPVITAWDEFGNSTKADITWDNIVPLNPSLVKQYFFIRSHPLKNIDLLFSIQSWFYWIILAVTIIALILDVFIEIKKQYPRVIISTLGFIFLLVVLIII